jgi:cytidylate kinase
VEHEEKEMTCSVIAVSRALAGGGEEIASLVAKEMGFRYVDNEIIDEAAKTVGVSASEVSRVEHTDPVFVRLLLAMGSSASLEPMAAVAPDYAVVNAYTGDYQRLIEQVIRQTANEGKAVIVAHGASIPLAGMEGLLRVLVTGSLAARAARLAGEAGVDAKRAEEMIEESDKQRAQFLRRFYKVRREEPTHYDLVVNTDNLSVQQAADVILTAARS